MLRGYTVRIRRHPVEKGKLQVLLDGQVIGFIRSRIANPFGGRPKGAPWGFFCSDSHSGEVFAEALDAADTLAARKLTGEPPPGLCDVSRWTSYERRCLGTKRIDREAWMAARGPYTALHPWDEPVGDWPPCNAKGPEGPSESANDEAKS